MRFLKFAFTVIREMREFEKKLFIISFSLEVISSDPSKKKLNLLEKEKERLNDFYSLYLPRVILNTSSMAFSFSFRTCCLCSVNAKS